MDSKGRKIIVCDAGTESIKCGFADSNIPAHIIPSMVGKRCIDDSKREVNAVKDMMVGDEARKHCRKQKMNYPVDNIGIVRNWEDMKHLWDYAFGETKLNVDPKTCKILLTEPPMYPMLTREKTIEIMFEDYKFEGVSIGIQPILTLYARGLLTGVVIDCGDGSTHISPVCEGLLLPDLTKRLDIGGRDITNYLRELPDGQVIKLGYERFRAPEVLFQPGLIGTDKAGVAEILFNTLQAIDIDKRADYYKHIVLCGGGTMFPGFSSRMEREIKQLYCERVFNGDTSKLSNVGIRIVEHEQPQHAVFVGGALQAGIMKDKEGFWMTRQEYEEKGIYVLEKLGVRVRGKVREKYPLWTKC
ncbi:actin-related protein 2-like [Orbicella faveolata]|uniref:actin-related protein 2-like n=1 Tax=Orbicella faveolata TaxID=48498 RepID=UPI0009E45659|nr:actin-related protein 2-like [Orbicella faveolata]